MRVINIGAFAAVLSGCRLLGDDAVVEGPPGEGMPSGCDEVGRVPVDDPSAIPDGFTFPASDAIAAVAGEFSGDLVTYDEEGAETGRVSLSLQLAVTSVDAVSFVYVEPPDGSMGEAELACAPAYDLNAVVGLSTDDQALAESFDVAIRAAAPGTGSWSALVPLADMGGSARPSQIDPAEWDAVALSVSASMSAAEGDQEAPVQDTSDTGSAVDPAAGHWLGSVGFEASRDTSDEDVFDTASGTGTISPSGMSETLGSFEVARP